MEHYFTKLRRYFSDWQADLIQIEVSLVDSAFCGRFQHRMPHQYLHDPIPRAQTFLKRFSEPRRKSPNKAVHSTASTPALRAVMVPACAGSGCE
jgi:hypothetical protein